MNDKELGIPLETLSTIEETYLRFTIDDIPASPMIPDEILDAIPYKHLDIRYANNNDQQFLDLYLPPEAKNEKVPLLVHIHGGGWMAGDKRDMQVSMYFGLLNQGYALASINYRLSGEASFPDPLMDCKAAIRFLKAQASKYGIDAARVAVCGGSAGAHLALMIALTPNVATLEDLSMGNSSYGTDVRCAIAAYPPTEISVLLNSDPSAPENAFMGGVIDQMDSRQLDMASPCHFVTPQMPPVLLRVGTADTIVPYTQSVLLARRIQSIAGSDKLDFKIVEGAGHADPAFKMPSYLQEVSEFLAHYMKA